MKLNRRKLPAFIILTCVFVYFFKHLFPLNGNFIGGIDVAEYFFWHAHFIKEQILSCNIPLWNPYYYCGHPFIANPSTFVFYPSTFFFVALPLAWAFNLDTLLHICLAFAGMYCFGKLITGSKGAGFASGIVYSLSGYFMDGLFAGNLLNLHTAALLPWIFYLFERGCTTKKTNFFLAAGFVFGLQILSGGPQNNLYTAYFIPVFFIIRYIFAPKCFNFHTLRFLLLRFFIIYVIAFALSAVQILPSLEFMSLSDRAIKSYDFATFFSFPPENFFTFLVPKPDTSLININWEFGGYVGILSIILAGIGGIYAKQRKYTLCFGIMLFLAATIMLGHHTPFYWVYYKLLPGISTFRIPTRCLVIFVFSMSILVGFGVQQISELPPKGKRHIPVTVGPIILLLCLIGGAKIFQISLSSKEMLLSLGLILGTLIVLNIARFIKNKHIIAGLLIVFLFFDLFIIYSPRIPKINEARLLKKRNYELALEQDPGLYRVAFPMGTLRGMKFHYYNVNAYTPVALNHFFRFIHDMANIPKPMLRRHTLNPNLFQPHLVFSSKILGIKYAIVKTQEGYAMIRANQVMPRAVLVKEAIVLPNLEDHLIYIKRSDFNPRKEVILEIDPHSGNSPESKIEAMSTNNDRVEILKYEPNRTELKSESKSDTYLVLSELFYPGWCAYVDGKKESILRANFLLRAIPLTPGEHNILFVYRPKSFFLGASISLFTLLLLGFIYLLHFRKKVRGGAVSG